MRKVRPRPGNYEYFGDPPVLLLRYFLVAGVRQIGSNDGPVSVAEHHVVESGEEEDEEGGGQEEAEAPHDEMCQLVKRVALTYVGRGKNGWNHMLRIKNFCVGSYISCACTKVWNRCEGSQNL